MILEKRIKYSFLVSLGLHLLVIWFFAYISVKEKREIKFITNIDMVEPYVAPPVPKEAPKNIWEFMKMALPAVKKPEMPKEEKPLEVVKKEIEKAMEVERKLIDKTAPLAKRPDALKFKDIEREKDQKLADIMKTMDNKKLNELIEQERKLTDRGQPAAKRADALKFDEVGLKRADKIEDVMTKAEAGKNSTNEKLRELTPADLLTEKKVPLEKSGKTEDLGIKLKSRQKDEGKIKDVIGTPEERKKVREFLAMEEKLVENTVKIASKSGAAAGGKPAGYGAGGIDLKNEELKKIETKVNIAPVKKNENGAALERAGAGRSSVELVGPLQSRGIVASYIPKSPEWMQEKGIEADTAVRFFVAPNGTVKDEMSIERTSGYPELDKLVMAVLKSWQFEALSKSVKQEDQWGVVTFRFKLKS